MSMKGRQAARKTAHAPASLRSHYSRVERSDSDSDDEDVLHSVRPRGVRTTSTASGASRNTGHKVYEDAIMSLLVITLRLCDREQ